MIYTDDKLLHTNVYAKSYTCPYEKIGICIQDFMTQLQEVKARKKGDIFYTFLKIDKDATATIKVFISVLEYCGMPGDGFRFHSYFVLDQMLSTVVLEDFERIESKYAQLMIYADTNDLQMISNIYTTVHAVGNKKYIIIKVAVDGIQT